MRVNLVLFTSGSGTNKTDISALDISESATPAFVMDIADIAVH